MPIHPTAIIDKQVRLADDAQIGPGCVIQGEVTIGEGCTLIAHAHLQGPLTIGSGNTIYPFVSLGLAPQDRKFNPSILGAGARIGNDNVLRESVSIHRATKDKPTTIGDRNYLMACSHIGHDVQMGSDCMLANCALVGGHVQIADQVLLGGGVGIQQFTRIGRLAMVSGNSGIAKDLPPFCVSYTLRRVASLNLVGLRRAGHRQHIPALQKAFEILYKQEHSNQTAVNLIEQELGSDPLCMEIIEFVRSGERGIVRYGGRRSENILSSIYPEQFHES